LAWPRLASWTQRKSINGSSSRLKKSVLDKDLMSATFLRYKGAEAGEADWRPTETIPEDYDTL